jgi:hypothetical protein
MFSFSPSVDCIATHRNRTVTLSPTSGTPAEPFLRRTAPAAVAGAAGWLPQVRGQKAPR